MAYRLEDATPMWDIVSPEDDKAVMEKFVEESNKVISRWSLGNASFVEKDAAVSFLVQLGVVQITIQSDSTCKQEDSQKRVSIQFGHELHSKTETEHGSTKQVEIKDAPINRNLVGEATPSQDQDTKAENQTHIDDEEEEDNNYYSAWNTELDDESDDDEMQISDKTPVVKSQQPKEEHPCPDCHVILNSTWDLDLHKLHDCAKPVKPIQYVYNCEECSKSFTNRLSAVNHLCKVHNIAPTEVVEKLAQMKDTQRLQSSKESKKQFPQLRTRHLFPGKKTRRKLKRSHKPPVLKRARKKTQRQIGVLMEEGEFEDQQAVEQQKQSGKMRRRGKARNWNSGRYSCLLSKTPLIKLQPLASGWMKVLENEAIDVSKFVPTRPALAASVSTVERSEPVHAPNNYQGLNCKAGNDNPNPLHEDESLDISEEREASADMPKQQTVEEDIVTSLSAVNSDELPDQGDAVEEVEGKHEENLIPRRGPEDVKEDTERESSVTLPMSQNSEDEVEDTDSNKELFTTDEHQDSGCTSRQREEDNQDASTDPDIENERQRPDPDEGIGEPSELIEHKSLHELSDKKECKNNATSKKSRENEGNTKTCPLCNLQFTTLYKRRKHISEVHKEYEQLKYKCSTCGKSFNQKYIYSTHVETHLAREERKKYHCKICNKTYLSKYIYKDHMRLHDDQSEQFKCDTCGKVLASKKNLERHVNSVHIKEVKFTCEVCGKKFYSTNKAKVHMDTHKKERPYKCDECGKGFVREYLLRLHFQNVHSNADRCLCDICGSSFKTKGILKQHHLTAHTDIFKYSCDVCGKKFKRSSNLYAHLKVHSNDPSTRPFKCELCSKGFRSSYKLKVHMNWHNDIRSHTCYVCGKSFLTKGNLDKHLYTHKQNKPHECSVCSRGFSDMPGLRKHLGLVHNITLKMVMTKQSDKGRGVKVTQESDSDVSVHESAVRPPSPSKSGSSDSDGDSSKYDEADHQESFCSSSVAQVSKTTDSEIVREALLAMVNI